MTITKLMEPSNRFLDSFLENLLVSLDRISLLWKLLITSQYNSTIPKGSNTWISMTLNGGIRTCGGRMYYAAPFHPSPFFYFFRVR